MRLRLCRVDEVTEDRLLTEHPDSGDPILVVRTDGKFHAVDALCPHQYAPLLGGELEDGILTCPMHQWRFDVRTGESPDMPVCLQHWTVEVADGVLWIIEP